MAGAQGTCRNAVLCAALVLILATSALGTQVDGHSPAATFALAQLRLGIVQGLKGCRQTPCRATSLFICMEKKAARACRKSQSHTGKPLQTQIHFKLSS